MKKMCSLVLQSVVVMGKVPMLYNVLLGRLTIQQCNEIVWDSFFHILVGLNSLQGSCVASAGPPMGLAEAGCNFGLTASGLFWAELRLLWRLLEAASKTRRDNIP
jgi:hypothetical protein